MARIKLSDLKIYLWTSWSEQDDRLNLLIANIQTILESILWDLTSWTKTEKICICDVDNSWGFYLKIPNPSAITKINWKSYTWTLDTDYMFDWTKVIIKDLYAYLTNLEFKSFKIEYTAWYNPIPKDLQQAMFILIAQELNKTEWSQIKSYKLWPRTVQFMDNSEVENQINSINRIILKYKTYKITSC